MVVIVAGSSGGSDATGVSTLTVGGISATKVIEKESAASDVFQSMWKADVPTGTTADVVVTWNTDRPRCSVASWSVYDANTTETATLSATDTDTTSGGSINVPANGVLISSSYVTGNAGDTTTWDNPSEDFDTGPVEGGSDEVISGASDDALSDAAYASAQSSLSCVSTASATPEHNVMVAAAWGL